MRMFWVYILASRSRVLYVGVTNDLLRRIREHPTREVPGFTAKYRIDRLVHCEETDDIEAAIAREKEIKGWRRSKKIVLIEAANPAWIDLSEGWFESALQEKAGPSLELGMTTRSARDDWTCHPERSEGSASARTDSRSLAALGMTTRALGMTDGYSATLIPPSRNNSWPVI